MTVTQFAGPLLPAVIVSVGGRAQPNHVVEVLHPTTLAGVPVYTDRDRTPATLPLRTDATGNFTGYFAEPGFYVLKAGQFPAVSTLATVDPGEVSQIPGPKGDDGEQGIQGLPGVGTNEVRYTAMVAAAVWEIPHSFVNSPDVSVFNPDGEEVFPTVTNPTSSLVRITHGVPNTGYALLRGK